MNNNFKSYKIMEKEMNTIMANLTQSMTVKLQNMKDNGIIYRYDVSTSIRGWGESEGHPCWSNMELEVTTNDLEHLVLKIDPDEQGNEYTVEKVQAFNAQLDSMIQGFICETNRKISEARERVDSLCGAVNSVSPFINNVKKEYYGC